MRSSIRIRLTVAFIGLAIGPLLLVGIILAWQNLTVQEQQALNLQHEVAQRVAAEVTAFFSTVENQLRVVSQVQGLQSLDREQQRHTLSELLIYEDIFEELVLLDHQGQEQIHLSRINPIANLDNRAKADAFIIPQTTEQVYYSPVRFDETTGEPFMTIAAPLVDARTGLTDGVLLSEVRIKKIWDLIADIRVSPGQSVYIVDTLNTIIAHRNPSLVLQGAIFNVPDQDGVQPGLDGSSTVMAVDKLHLGHKSLILWLNKSG
ncbi:MAG: cache domain-containing protein [Anaerolineae bacterium]